MAFNRSDVRPRNEVSGLTLNIIYSFIYNFVHFAPATDYSYALDALGAVAFGHFSPAY